MLNALMDVKLSWIREEGASIGLDLKAFITKSLFDNLLVIFDTMISCDNWLVETNSCTCYKSQPSRASWMFISLENQTFK